MEASISHATTGYNGLKNEGATCYINSLLQSLFHTNEFRRIIYDLPVDPKDYKNSFIFWLKYIFYVMQFGGVSKTTTKQMIRCFNWNEMTETNQQDIHEFLRRLLEKVEKFVEGTEFEARLSNLFVGIMQTSTKCKNVDYQSNKTETFWDIQLPINENPDIHSAFKKYLDKLTISGFQYGDGDNMDDAWQQLKFISLPPILYIHLKRFEFNSITNTSTKNNNRFEFGLKLDLSIHCSDAIYILHSVLVHSGSANTGHYVAFICPKTDDQWYKFDDEIVTECSFEDAVQANYGNGIRTTNAYMLVYAKQTNIGKNLCEATKDNVVDERLIQTEMVNEINHFHEPSESVLSNKPIQTSLPMKETNNNFYFDISGVPMEWESIYESIQLETIELEDVDTSVIKIPDAMLKVGERKEIIKQSTPVNPFTCDSLRARQLNFTYAGRTNEHSTIDLPFDGDDSRQNTDFFNSKNDNVSESDGFTVQHTYNNGLNIGVGVLSLPIFRTDTIGNITNDCTKELKQESRVLRIKNGVILDIVSPEVKPIDLIGDGYTYRLELYDCPSYFRHDTFNVCVRFVKKCPENRLRTPILVEVNNGDSFESFKLRVGSILETNLKQMKNFEFEVVNDWLTKESKNGDTILVMPENPDFIPVITLNMNERRALKKKSMKKINFI